MKKILVILLLLSYGFSSMGMSVQINYCCGKVESVAVFTPARTCGMQHHMGSKPCCESKELKASPQKAHTAVISPVVAFHAPAILSPAYTLHPAAITAAAWAPRKGFDSSPPLPSQALFLLLCIFRI